MAQDDSRDNGSGFEAPRKLMEGLRSLYAGSPPVPAELDELVLAKARRRIARRRPLVVTLRWSLAGAAAAAALLALLVFAPTRRSAPAPAAQRAVAAAEDVNGDGRVDILDALALARSIESGRRTRSDWDINADGRVDRLDVDVIAMAAVSINRRSTQ